MKKSFFIKTQKEVETKFTKEIYTFLFPVDEGIKQIFKEYYNFLIKEKGFTSEDPLFPKLESVISKECLLLPPVMTKQNLLILHP